MQLIKNDNPHNPSFQLHACRTLMLNIIKKKKKNSEKNHHQPEIWVGTSLDEIKSDEQGEKQKVSIKEFSKRKNCAESNEIEIEISQFDSDFVVFSCRFPSRLELEFSSPSFSSVIMRRCSQFDHLTSFFFLRKINFFKFIAIIYLQSSMNTWPVDPHVAAYVEYWDPRCLGVWI